MTSYGDTWADIYDSVHSNIGDIPFWVDEAKMAGGPVLDLGCGTGRVSIPMAQGGVPVIGLDNSRAMLKRARAKARKLGLSSESLRFVFGDIRSFSLGQKFSLAIIPFRSFQLLLSVADQHQALATIKQHLTPSGRLIVSLFVPDLGYFAKDPSLQTFGRKTVDYSTGHEMLVGEQNSYDTFNQVVNARTIIEQLDEHGKLAQKIYKDYQMRYLYRFETLHLLGSSGYRVLDVYGSYNREPLDESSTEMVWIAKVR